jgi:hypothetical protein
MALFPRANRPTIVRLNFPFEPFYKMHLNLMRSCSYVMLLQFI